MGPCSSKSILVKSAQKGKKGSASPGNDQINNEPVAQRVPGDQNSTPLKLDASVFVQLRNESIHNYFKIGAKLGEGSFGEVSLVTHKTTGVVRAMKKIKKKAIMQEEENIMISEVKIMKELDHPNIVKVFELYQDNNWYYLITE